MNSNVLTFPYSKFDSFKNPNHYGSDLLPQNPRHPGSHKQVEIFAFKCQPMCVYVCVCVCVCCLTFCVCVCVCVCVCPREPGEDVNFEEVHHDRDMDSMDGNDATVFSLADVVRKYVTLFDTQIHMSDV